VTGRLQVRRFPHPAASEAIVTIVATDGASARAQLDADYTPQFIRVARVVRDRITDGTYPRLSLVPGSRALAAELHLSPEVVLHGLTILVRAGYLRHIESKPHQVIWDGDPGAEAEGPDLAGGGLVLSAG
jgi:hypothetical protein